MDGTRPIGSGMEKRVLSIQSHVVVGHVGNKASVFPIQLLGVEVDFVNTVQFSNHTGYGSWTGSKFGSDHLEDLFGGMRSNGLLRHTHLLTGYVPGAEALRSVAAMADELRSLNTDLFYVLDPVIGDDGKIYVSPDVVPVYKEMLPKADLATPNSFEAELLSDVEITSLETLGLCLETLHRRYRLPHVLVSSCLVPELGMVCAGSSLGGKRFYISFEAREEHFEGVGDLFASLVTAYADASRFDLAQTAKRAISAIQSVIRTTVEHARPIAVRGGFSLVASAKESQVDRVNRLRAMELRIVQSASGILNPERLYEPEEF